MKYTFKKLTILFKGDGKGNFTLSKQHVVPQLVYKRSDQLTEKMSDSDEGFDILRDISFEPLVTKLRDSINCKELAAQVHTHKNPEQPSGPQQDLDWCVLVCVGISLILISQVDLSIKLMS